MARRSDSPGLDRPNRFKAEYQPADDARGDRAGKRCQHLRGRRTAAHRRLILRYRCGDGGLDWRRRDHAHLACWRCFEPLGLHECACGWRRFIDGGWVSAVALVRCGNFCRLSRVCLCSRWGRHRRTGHGAGRWRCVFGCELQHGFRSGSLIRCGRFHARPGDARIYLVGEARRRVGYRIRRHRRPPFRFWPCRFCRCLVLGADVACRVRRLLVFVRRTQSAKIGSARLVYDDYILCGRGAGDKPGDRDG